MTAMIEVAGLKKSFGTHHALRGVDLDVNDGQILALLGPNGAGKSTLVRILATLLRPDAGSAVLAGHDLIRNPGAVRGVISLSGQSAAVDELLTGEENLRLMARLLRLPSEVATPRIREFLERFDLGAAARSPVRTYSGGMRRKLDLALSLISQPRILFLDEPTTGLDPGARLELWEIVRDLRAAGSTVLLTTQYLEEADALANEIVVINHGQVIARGTPASLKRELAHGEVALTFANEAMLAKALARCSGALREDPTERLTLVGDGENAETVRVLLNTLADSGVPVSRIALREPTLNDVFLRLTDQPAIAEEAA